MFWPRRRGDRDFSDEVRAHIELEAERLVAEGMPSGRARIEARRRFGNVLGAEERFYESQRVVWIAQFLQDLRIAIRGLRRTPAFSIIVVLTFALGIAVNTAVFTAVNGFFLRPLGGVPDPDSLVVVAARTGEGSLSRVSYPDYHHLRETVAAFDGIAGLSMDLVGMSDGGQPESLLEAFTTPNYFDMLGVDAAVGRMYRTGEGDIAGEAPVVVLGHRFWQRRFGGNARVIGRTVRLNTVPHTIIGVAPHDFKGTYSVVDFDVYVPLGQRAVQFPGSGQALDRRDNRNLLALARLRAGTLLEEAQAGVDVVSARLAAAYPEQNGGVAYRLFPEGLARPEPSILAGTASLGINLFLALSGVVLLVACLNVTTLLLIRSATRRRELAVRMALGADRWRIVRQLLTESLLLAGLGALLGGLVGGGAARGLGALRLGGTLPVVIDTALDLRVYAYVAALTVAAGVLVALWPALGLGRVGNGNLHTSAQGEAAAAGRSRALGALVIGQIAMSLVLLVAAGLLVRSLGTIERLDLGYEPRGLLNVTMDTAQVGYDGARTQVFRDELLARARSLPRVETASTAAFVPHGYAWSSPTVYVEGHNERTGNGQRRPTAGMNAVSEGYFETLRIPLVAGRAFEETDDAKRTSVAVVSETMASNLWPGDTALGRRFSMTGPDGPWIEVVGISRDGLYGLLPVDGPQNFFFVASRQLQMSGITSLQLRTDLDAPERLAPAIEREIAALAPDLPLLDVAAQGDLLLNANGVLMLRVAAVFAAVPGLIGLFLAGIGTYGVLGYAVAQRATEMGIRMALGARRSEIQGMVLGRAGVLIGLGLAIGLGVAIVVARLFEPVLAPDATTFVVVALALASAALLAAYFPARRATRVDPLVALRHD